jgi:hypothetical protein
MFVSFLWASIAGAYACLETNVSISNGPSVARSCALKSTKSRFSVNKPIDQVNQVF